MKIILLCSISIYSWPQKGWKLRGEICNSHASYIIHRHACFTLLQICNIRVYYCLHGWILSQLNFWECSNFVSKFTQKGNKTEHSVGRQIKRLNITKQCCVNLISKKRLIQSNNSNSKKRKKGCKYRKLKVRCSLMKEQFL